MCETGYIKNEMKPSARSSAHHIAVLQKEAVVADVFLFDGKKVTGAFYLSQCAPTHGGPETLLELLNDDDRSFIPFQCSSELMFLQRAAIHVQSSGREEVTGANVLVALFSERESNAVFFLQEQEMTRFDAVNYISHGIAKVPGRAEARTVHGAEEGTAEETVIRKGKEALDAYCINLNNKALRAEFSGPISAMKAQYSIGGLFAKREERTTQAHAALLVTGDAGAREANVQAGVGLRAVVLDTDVRLATAPNSVHSVRGGALGVGGMVDARIPAYNRIGGGAYLYWAPSVSSFGDVDGHFEYGLNAGYQILRNATLYAGYRQVKVDPAIAEYILNVVDGTRTHPDVVLGASTRAALALYRAVQAHAVTDGRDYAIPDDVKRLAEPVLAHRLVTRGWVQGGHPDAGPFVRDVLAKQKVPT